MKKLSVLLFIASLLSACATDYHAAGFLSKGYTDFKIANDSYLVHFSGNGFTNSDRAYKYALRRSAELTKEQGYQYFTIVKSSSIINKSTYVTPLNANTQANYYNGYSGFASGSSTTTLSGGDVITTERPTTSMVIKLHKSQVKHAYDADIILSNFKTK